METDRQRKYFLGVGGCGWRLLFGVFFVWAALAFPASGVSGADGRRPFSVDDLLRQERISDPQVSTDGKQVVFSVGRPDLAANKVHQSLYLGEIAERRIQKITAEELEAANGRFSPDGRFLYFLATVSGERQIRRLHFEDGKIEAVTGLPLDIDSFSVSPDGRFLILSMAVFPGKTPEETKALLRDRSGQPGSGRSYERLPVRHWDAWRDGLRSHLFVYRLGDGTLRDLMGAADADCPSRPFGDADDYSLSPDGRLVVFSAKDVGREEAWSTNYDLYRVSVAGAAPPVRITSNPAADIQPRFSPDGNTLAYLAAARPGNEADRFRIVLREWTTGREKTFDVRADDTASGDRSPVSLLWSQDGQTLYVTADHLGHHALFALDVRSGVTTILLKTGTVSSPRALPDGRVLFAWSSLLRPTELYVAGLSAGESQRATKLNDERMGELQMGKVGTFAFQDAQGRMVHGRVIYPAVFDEAKKYPVAFLIHGGPQTSNLNEFSYRWHPQLFAGAGYAVVAIDYPGSTGYGQAYTDAVSGDWGGAPYEDLRQGLEAALRQYPLLDRKRMAALGPSFGGYMVHWMAGRDHPFRCFVSHGGVFDKGRFYYQTDELWFPEWEGGGAPWMNPGGHGRHNPADGVRNWRTPTLILSGEKDYRVPLTQGLSAFTALQRQGIPSQLLVFPDEGHWILKPRNTRQWYATVLSWLDRWLRPEK